MAVILINGKKTEFVSATDRALHYGDGLFETVAIVNGKPRLWLSHMARLKRGCNKLGLPVPDLQQLYAEAVSFVESEEPFVLKIIYSRGSGGRGYAPPQTATPQRILLSYPWPDYSGLSGGIHLHLCQTPLACNPALAGIKHLNRLEQVVARSEWDEAAIHEGVMCDLTGNVKEGTMSNLFWVAGGELHTPDLSRCGVEGVMREQVINCANEIGIAVNIAEITPEQLSLVDELFMTNALIGIWPVASFAGHDFMPGELTVRLQSVLQEKLEASVA